MIKQENIYSRMLLLFGILAPMLILSIFSVTMYVWGILLLGIIALTEWIKCGKLKISLKYDRALGMLFITWIISYFICVLRMPSKWKNGIVTGFIQLLFLIIVCIYFSYKERFRYLKFYIKGVYISSIIQMIWAYLQIAFNAIGKDLNVLVFRDFFHMVEEYASQYQFGKLKASGLCWNAGNLAPLVIFGFVYTKKLYMKTLFFVLAFLSGSRTLMFGMLTCSVIQIILRDKTKKTHKRRTIYLVGIIIGTIFIMVVNFQTISIQISNVMDLLDIRNRVNVEGSASTHLLYWTSVIDVTKINNIVSNLFGYGPGCSGYPFSTFLRLYQDSEKWSVECDYINQLWSYGYIGFFVYYYWYIKNIIKCFKIEKKYIVLFITFLVEGVMYNITFNWVLFLLICIFFLAQKNINIFE